MSPEWDSRHYSFDSRWSPTEEMASMRDGCGNEYSVVFSAAGAYARGFDHESPMSPYGHEDHETRPGLFDGLPEVFRAYVTEPAFSAEDGGSAEWLFDVLADGRPGAYQEFAEEYYERAVDIDAVRHVYALRPLTRGVVSALNPTADLAGLAEDIAEIGYPV
ncbi:hypothetical protein ACQEWB_17085 [Streptomyces sp. CA-249302]|uniref:hypothetical protein n=1 Tax=Streptomyces sp. CA-249302 TaxID=3240058 RepID=UPI003D8B60F4